MEEKDIIKSDNELDEKCGGVIYNQDGIKVDFFTDKETMEELMKFRENKMSVKITEGSLNSAFGTEEFLLLTKQAKKLFNLTPPEGFEYYLGREYVLANADEMPDLQNMLRLYKEGWHLVPSERHPELAQFHVEGRIRYRGLILLERDKVTCDLKRMVLEKKNKEIIDSLPALRRDEGRRWPELSYEDAVKILGPEARAIEDRCRDIKVKFGLKRSKLICKNIKLETTFLGRILSKIPFLNKVLFGCFQGESSRSNFEYDRCGFPKRLINSTFVIFSGILKRFFLFRENIQFRYRIGKYKLDIDEKEICELLEISEESYVKNKHELEISSIE